MRVVQFQPPDSLRFSECDRSESVFIPWRNARTSPAPAFMSNIIIGGFISSFREWKLLSRQAPKRVFFSPLASVITLWMRSLTRGSHLELIWRLDSLDTTFSKPTIFISPSRRALPNPSSESASLCRVGTFNRRSTCYFKRNSAIIRRETSFQDSSCYCRRSFPISEMHRVQAHPIISICTSSVTSAVKVTG